MDFTDKTIVCVDCGAEFMHSADDQKRYAERGFTNEPKRCRTCREKRKTSTGGPRRGAYSSPAGGGGGMDGGRGGPRGPKQLFDAVCAECGQTTQVPFKPTEGRPVYCRTCFQARRDGAGGAEGRRADFD